MLSARDIADYFLGLVDDEAGDSLSNLKLQKLVYYAQGFHLAIHGKKLFQQPIEAWEHGPVVPWLYHQLKQHGAEPVPRPEDGIDTSKYPPPVRELLDDVWSVYGQYSAAKLRNITHSEPPWKDAYAKAPSSMINEQKMKEYFSTQLVHGKG
ncbi:MAG: SocA family protein [Bryobacterales bacterium]|nr:SocA family protein [Bryobacterales bacterium]